MISSHLMGGLGNMMFQIAAGYSHSLRMEEKFMISYNHMTIQNHPPFMEYESNIFRNVQTGKIDTNIKYTEPFFNYHPLSAVKNTLFWGYFQSEKYFINHESEIRSLFEPSETIKKNLKDRYGNVNDYTSLHVRRGDYLNLSAHHPTCTMEYYKKALNRCPGKVLVFSDDIDWCKNNFLDPRFEFVSNNLDYEDLYLMSMCKNNIIANSSFSWWGAWLNKNPNKVVIAPKVWFGSAINHDTKDLLPVSWTTM